MKVTQNIALVLFVMLFGLSACKSAEKMQDSGSATAEKAEMAMEKPAAQTATSGDMDIDDLISRHLEARGGVDKIKAIQTMKMEGEVEMSGMKIVLTTYIKRPNMVRTDLKIAAMNMEMKQGYDGKSGWMQQQDGDPQPMPKSMTEGMKDQSNLDGMFMDYKENNISVDYMGEADVNGSPAHKLKVVRPNRGDTLMVYLDSTSLLTVMQEGEGINPQNGAKVQTQSIMSDYRVVNGVQMVHKVDVMMDGNPAQKVVFSNIETGIEVDDMMFKMPAPKVDLN